MHGDRKSVDSLGGRRARWKLHQERLRDGPVDTAATSTAHECARRGANARAMRGAVLLSTDDHNDVVLHRLSYPDNLGDWDAFDVPHAIPHHPHPPTCT